MKPEQAQHIIGMLLEDTWLWNDYTEQTRDDVVETLQLALVALEKQVPKKAPTETLANNAKWYHCPVCNQVWIDEQRYCGCCGQAIDWEGQE